MGQRRVSVKMQLNVKAMQTKANPHTHTHKTKAIQERSQTHTLIHLSNCRYCLLNANALVAFRLSPVMSHAERFPFKLIALLIGHFSRVFCRLPLVGILVAALALVLRICANSFIHCLQLVLNFYVYATALKFIFFLFFFTFLLCS